MNTRLNNVLYQFRFCRGQFEPYVAQNLYLLEVVVRYKNTQHFYETILCSALNKNKNPFLVLIYCFLGPKEALFLFVVLVVVVFASY